MMMQKMREPTAISTTSSPERMGQDPLRIKNRATDSVYFCAICALLLLLSSGAGEAGKLRQGVGGWLVVEQLAVIGMFMFLFSSRSWVLVWGTESGIVCIDCVLFLHHCSPPAVQA